MEQNIFAMGIKPKKNKRERRKCVLVRRRRGPYRGRLQSWRILPESHCDALDFWIDTTPGKSFFEKRRYIYQTMSSIATPIRPSFPMTSFEETKKQFLQKANQVLLLLDKNQELRWKFKNFLTKARILRFRRLNDCDSITLEPFKQPIYLHSFGTRLTYTFEAKSIIRYIHKQLTEHNGQIPTPVEPRNPYTNQKFSIYQLISIFEQARKYAHTSWAIEAFRHCNYELRSFSILHRKPLRLEALQLTMKDVHDYEANDILLDFIKSQHEENNKNFSNALYTWAIHHHPHHETIEKWRKLCLQWYEVDIVDEDDLVKEMKFRLLTRRTKEFCETPTNLTQLRLQSIKIRRRVDGSGSVRHTENTG